MERTERSHQPAERVFRRSDPQGRGRCQRVWVHFYSHTSYDWKRETCRTRAEFLIWRLLCGQYVHCNVQVDEWLYDCCRAHGCQIFPLELAPATPALTVPVWATPYRMAFCVQEEFDVIKSLLHVTHLLPRRMAVMNCVQATRELLGVEEEARTPRDLLRVLTRRM